MVGLRVHVPVVTDEDHRIAAVFLEQGIDVAHSLRKLGLERRLANHRLTRFAG